MSKETQATCFRFLLILALGFLPALEEALRTSGPLDIRLLALALVIALAAALEKTWGTRVLLPAIARHAARKAAAPESTVSPAPAPAVESPA